MGGQKKQTIGYKYKMGMHMIICHGPVDSVQKIIAGEREAWAGNVTTNSTITIDNEELFGGEKKEGGIKGDVDVLMGADNQTKNSYLQQQLGAVIPAFRGVVSLVLKHVLICAMSPYPKAWAVKVKRIPAKTWNPTRADINGSANPIHCIYECLTNTDWGLGTPVANIDDASFTAAANTCFNEGLGVSMLLSGQGSIEEFIQEIMKHANGAFYTTMDTGKFAVRLFRDDYDASTLTVLDPSNIVSLDSFDRASPAEMVNEIVVKYRPQGAIADDTVTVQNLASIQAQGGIVSQTISYGGIDNATNAGRVAMRDLRQRSTPLGRVTIKVNRKQYNFTLGDVFKLTWPEHGLVDIVFRILSINSGTLKDGTITFTAVEDIFGLPSATYIGNQPSGWTDPIQPPSLFEAQRFSEVSYWEFINNFDPYIIDTVDPLDSYLVAYAGVPNQYAPQYEMHVRIGSGGTYNLRDTESPCPWTRVAAPFDKLTTTVTYTGGKSVDSALVGKFADIGEERVEITAVNTALSTLTIKRGILDTVPVDHLATELIMFGEDLAAVGPSLYQGSVDARIKLLMKTGTSKMPINSVPETALIMRGRQGRPYPAANMKFNLVSFPSTAVNGVTALTWVNRNRLQQTAKPYVGYYDSNIAPEAGVTYTVEIRRTNGANTLIKSETGLTALTYSWPTENADTQGLAESSQQFTVIAMRDGLASWQSATLTVERAGMGYNLGNYLGGA